MMVFQACPRCGHECAPWVTDHPREECDANIAENERAAEEHRRANEAWEAKIAKLKADGEYDAWRAKHPPISLPQGRVITPSLFLTGGPVTPSAIDTAKLSKDALDLFLSQFIYSEEGAAESGEDAEEAARSDADQEPPERS